VQPGTDAAHRRRAERDRSAIQLGQVPDNREAEARTWRGLVGADAALQDRLPHRRLEAGAVIVDRDEDAGAVGRRVDRDMRPRPFAGVVEHLDNVREVERRIQTVEAFNLGGELRELPEAPAGVPDSFSEHVRLMFDLQLLAFKSDVARVFAFKLGRDNSNRTFPESGFGGAFHNTSHHSGGEERVLDFAKINRYHVGTISSFLDGLASTPDGDGTLLGSTVLLYGSPIGDSNLHNHKRVPFFIAGRAGGALPGGLHLKAATVPRLPT
jgi:Protein of unknown function (DUF1552)